MIRKAADMRGTDLVTFMESQYGGYWSDRYYSAEPDAGSG
jgi:hypothetical protein